MERILDQFYPPLEQREPVSQLFLPASTAAIVFGYTFGPGLMQTFFVAAVLLALFFARPYYTDGSVVTDYTMSSGFVVSLLSFLDLGTSAEGGPRYVGPPGKPLPRPVGKRDLKTWWQKFKWSLGMATTPRGIGWDWQVKNVPAHPDGNLPRFHFVATRVVEVVWRSALKALAVYCIGFSRTVQPTVTSPLASWLLSAVIGWCGAVWSWNTIGVAHAAGAVITVAIGLCEPWEWPPVFDALEKAWSVRQVWSTTYHQILRQPLQQPGIRLARFLGLKKGTFGSRYLQLYLAFFLSFSVHWWQAYNVARGDRGEFAFFMSQPVIITIEDFLQWVWHKSVSAKRRESLALLEYRVGYVWTIAAFTMTLIPVMRGWTGMGLIGSSGPDEVMALRLGQQHGAAYLSG